MQNTENPRATWRTGGDVRQFPELHLLETNQPLCPPSLFWTTELRSALRNGQNVPISPPSSLQVRGRQGKERKRISHGICTQRKRSTVGFVLFSTNSNTSLFTGEAVARHLDFRLWSHAPRRTDGTSTVHRYLGGAFTVTLVLTFVVYTYIYPHY